MKWHDYNPATKPFNFIQTPRYAPEEDWFTMEDIQKTIEEKTGMLVSSVKIGRIARRYNLCKKIANFKVYHKKVIDIILSKLKN